MLSSRGSKANFINTVLSFNIKLLSVRCYLLGIWKEIHYGKNKNRRIISEEFSTGQIELYMCDNQS